MEAVALADSVLLLAGAPARLRWRLDLKLPALQRGDAWVHRQTALLLAQGPVRAAFELPPLTQAGIATDPADDDLSAGHALTAIERVASHSCEVAL